MSKIGFEEWLNAKDIEEAENFYENPEARKRTFSAVSNTVRNKDFGKEFTRICNKLGISKRTLFIVMLFDSRREFLEEVYIDSDTWSLFSQFSQYIFDNDGISVPKYIERWMKKIEGVLGDE